MEQEVYRKYKCLQITDYLSEYKGPFALFLLFIIIFSIVFYLYNLPIEAVFYGALLCMCMFVPVLLCHYSRFQKKARMLLNMQQAFMEEPEHYYFEEYPFGATALEQGYRNFVQLLFEDRERIRSREALAREEMIDYYTLWVHQIKTPIAAMRLLAQSQECGPDRELEEQLFKIEKYVSMVLQYLRMDGDDLIIKWKELDFIVRQAVHKYAGMFIRKKLSLHYEPLQCKVLTDEKWLIFVIEQLLSNAVKYTRSGGVSIYMENEPETTLVICDTGIGIAWEDQPRIFEKGFTGCNGHEDKRSTGIGLYMCRRILKRLSHDIIVESEPGKGTKIRIRLEVEPLLAE